MDKPVISLIASLGERRELGKNNELLWHIPEDLKRFKRITTGHPVIMGRKTFTSLGKPLKNRRNIVISRSPVPPDLPATVDWAASLEKALDKAREYDREEIFIIGGGEIYAEGIKYASRLYLTLVEGRYEADTYFPDYSAFTRVVGDEPGGSGQYRFRYITLER